MIIIRKALWHISLIMILRFRFGSNFETLALGEFGTLYDCACTDVKLYVSKIMKLPTNLDSDGMNTQFLYLQ